MAGRVGLEWCWSRVITRVTSCGCCSQTRGGRGGSRGHGRRRTEMNMRAPDTRGVDVVQNYGNGVWNNSLVRPDTRTIRRSLGVFFGG